MIARSQLEKHASADWKHRRGQGDYNYLFLEAKVLRPSFLLRELLHINSLASKPQAETTD